MVAQMDKTLEVAIPAHVKLFVQEISIENIFEQRIFNGGFFLKNKSFKNFCLFT